MPPNAGSMSHRATSRPRLRSVRARRVAGSVELDDGEITSRNISSPEWLQLSLLLGGSWTLALREHADRAAEDGTHGSGDARDHALFGTGAMNRSHRPG